MITTSTEWQALVAKPCEMVVVMRLYYGLEGSTDFISIASKDVTIGTENFLGVIKGIPDVSQGVNMDTHEIITGSLRVEFMNTDYEPAKRISDYFTNGLGSYPYNVGFENRRADVRLYVDGITSWDNCFKLKSVGVTRQPTHGRETMELEIEDGVDLWFKILDHTVDESDGYLASGLPASSRGLVKPWLYGNKRYKINTVRDGTRDLLASNWDQSKLQSLPKMVDLGNGYWFVSSNQLHGDSGSNPDFDDGDGIWMWNNTYKRFMELVDWSVVSNTSDGMIIRRTGDSFYDYAVPVSVSAASWTNPDNMIDGDVDTYAEATIAAGDPVGTQKSFQFNYDTNVEYIPAADLTSLKLFMKYKESPIGTGIMDMYVTDKVFNRYQYGTAGTDSQFRAHTDITSNFPYPLNPIGTGGNFVFGRYEKVVAVAAAQTMRIYQAFMRAEFEDATVDQLYYGGTGQEYGTWINGRSTAEGYTETHANDDDSGDLIENYAGLLESFLRDVLGMADSNIDMDSFNILSNDIAGDWSRMILTNADTKTIMHSMLQDGHTFMWWNTDGEVKVKAIADTYSSSDRVINYRDCESLEFERTDPREIKTVVSVGYDFDGSKYMFTTGQSSKANARQRWNVSSTQSTLKHLAQTTSDETAAIVLRDYLIEQQQNPHLLATAVLGKEHLDLDIGDVIEFEDVPFKAYGKSVESNASEAGQTWYKYFWIYNVTRGEKMTIQAFQLHDLS